MLRHITLHLARNSEFPEGSAERGYEIIAPLDASGHLGATEWRTLKAQCRVRRFWAGESDRHGTLVHHAGGASGATWKIDYDAKAQGDEETGVHLGTHRFIENEYVSIRDEEGRSHTFKIVRVQPAKASKGRSGRATTA
jgi:hypothetical protein